jgi:hypothetical protein
VRSATRLDLYAKSMALVVLGLLGAGAALIDHWPGVSALPVVGSPVARVVPDDFSGATPVSDAPAARIVRVRDNHGRRSTASPDDLALEDLAPDDVAPAPDAPEALVVAATELPAPRLLALPAPPVVEAAWLPLLPPPMMASDRSDDGFFSGMLKRTGSSVTTSLGKASTSVVGAVRVVGDAVRRLRYR